MSILTTDPLETVITVLNNWTSANTDNITPTIQKVFDAKEVDLRVNDYIQVYSRKTIIEKNSIGVLSRRVIETVAIDIRTAHPSFTTQATLRTHAIKVLKEVDRLVNASIIAPDSNYAILDPDEGYVDLSDKMKGLQRFVYEVKLMKTNTTRS